MKDTTLIKPKRGRKNKLGILGWLYGGRYGVERYLYALQRLAGLVLILYLIIHIFVVGTRIKGELAWQSMMQLLESPTFRFLEYLLFAVFLFHGLNGLRLILIEWLTVGIGKPKRPVYPYEKSTVRQRPLTIALMIVTFILMLVAIYGFYFME